MFRLTKKIFSLPLANFTGLTKKAGSFTPFLSMTSSRFFSGKRDDGKQEEISEKDQQEQTVLDQDGKPIKNPLKNEQEDENEDDNSFSNEKKKSFYFFAVAGVGLLGGYAIMQLNAMKDEKQSLKSQRVHYTGKADIGGPWKLIDMEGKEVTHKDLKGSYYLIYFGFCNCPDICPISLSKVSKALDQIRKMPEYRYIKLKTLFVSVDPDRDTPERMNKFLSHFDKSIIGLTGKSNDDPDLKNCMKKFRIYATKIELDEAPKKGGKKPYTLDHTIITYLMDDTNNYLTHLGSNLSDKDMASIIVDSILQNERDKAKGGR